MWILLCSFALNSSGVYVLSTLLSILACLPPSKTSNRWMRKISKGISNIFHAVSWVCAREKNNKTLHLNINIKVIPFYTLYILVLVGPMNKGAFLLTFSGKGESIMQNKSAWKQFDVWPQRVVLPQILDGTCQSLGLCSWCWEAWTPSLTVEMIKRK